MEENYEILKSNLISTIKDPNFLYPKEPKKEVIEEVVTPTSETVIIEDKS